MSKRQFAMVWQSTRAMLTPAIFSPMAFRSSKALPILSNYHRAAISLLFHSRSNMAPVRRFGRLHLFQRHSQYPPSNLAAELLSGLHLTRLVDWKGSPAWSKRLQPRNGRAR